MVEIKFHLEIPPMPHYHNLTQLIIINNKGKTLKKEWN